MREPQKIPGIGFLPTLSLGVSLRESPKSNQADFRRFPVEMEFMEPMAQHGLKPFSIPLAESTRRSHQ